MSALSLTGYSIAVGEFSGDQVEGKSIKWVHTLTVNVNITAEVNCRFMNAGILLSHFPFLHFALCL